MKYIDIPVRSVGFNPAEYRRVQGLQNCRCQISDLVWASFTVGKREMHKLPRGDEYARFEFHFRRYMINAFLKPEDRRLKPSPAFLNLDSSERGAISYFLGLATSKLLAEKYLGASYLLHLDIFYEQLKMGLEPMEPLKNGRPRTMRETERPDLVGKDALGRWLSLEAKGTSGVLNSGTLRGAKEQARKLQSVCGQAPHLCIGLQSYFQSSGLAVKWVDPPNDPKAAISLTVNDEHFYKKYYEPFLNLLANTPFSAYRNDREYKMYFLPNTDVAIGLDSMVFDTINNNENWERTVEELHRLATTNAEEKSAFVYRNPNLPYSFTIGGDGILVYVGKWNYEEFELNTPNTPFVICELWPQTDSLFESNWY